MGSQKEDPVIMELCASCKQLTDSAITHEGFHYCKECMDSMPVEQPELYGLAFLLATIPFHVGDKVECRTAGQLYDGVGTVAEVDTELKMGGTPVYPAFRVHLEQKAEDFLPDELWYTECCLKRAAS
jgi:hypothetical protein